MAPGDGGAARHLRDGQSVQSWTVADLRAHVIPILRQGECPASLLMSMSPSIGGHANYGPPGDGGARSMVT